MEDRPAVPRAFEPIGSGSASPTGRPASTGERSLPRPVPPPPPPPGTGWWLASDGNWYPPRAPAGPTTTNRYAIASLVLGILWIYWIGSVLALLFGYLGKRKIDASHGRETGRGLALAGIVLGWIAVAVLALGVLGLALGSESEPRFDEVDDSVGGATFDLATLVGSCQSGASASVAADVGHSLGGMSIPVDLDALRDEVARHERPAYVITAGAEGSPHLVAQFLTWADGAFETECGGTTARNLSERPEVSVVVPPDEPDGYSLIFDATGEVVDGEARKVRLTPTKAVLHRPAPGPTGDASCGHDCAPVGAVED